MAGEEGLTDTLTHSIQLRVSYWHSDHWLDSSQKTVFSLKKSGLPVAASVLKHNIIWHQGRGHYTRKTFTLIFLSACEGEKNQ